MINGLDIYYSSKNLKEEDGKGLKPVSTKNKK